MQKYYFNTDILKYNFINTNAMHKRNFSFCDHFDDSNKLITNLRIVFIIEIFDIWKGILTWIRGRYKS